MHSSPLISSSPGLSNPALGAARNTGFFRYWLVSNLPLFGLAAPTLFVLLKSGLDVLADSPDSPLKLAAHAPPLQDLVRCMAVAQVTLALLAITNYHVQIIARISSGYPVWYWWLAGLLTGRKASPFGNGFLTFMIVYAAVQGVLFASFLPPA